MQDTHFFLGRAAGDGQPIHYNPADLNTHAVVIGMTGSGKTGLLIGLLEEAALKGIPAIVIDPKGDLTNLLLHFAEQRGEDFLPWVDPEQARREGISAEALAERTAAAWSAGLAKWGLGAVQLERLTQAVEYSVYTPGSTAGTPVSLLSSFDAPPDWETNREAMRERAASTVTALLGLVGLTDIDPLRSREHILLANILEHAWSRGQNLDLPGLIGQVTTPPFNQLGAFPLERFFPEKDRFELALLLNNFLAAPSFQTWLEGQPLDGRTLLYAPDGKPRFSVFYLAHLSDNERMFFVTLLLAAVEAWMRGQRGTSSLRALLAFDEMVGYLPPTANPPSRPVLLRLLKQARAFGLGIVLSTQNPTDLNYKALSNAGTWFIGRLQTERDKERLLDGLQSLEAGVDRAAFERIIARLGKRQFLLHNIHTAAPAVFDTRWALNFLAGPLTRAQLPDLRALGLAADPLPPARPAAPAPSAPPTPGAAMPAASQTPAPSSAARSYESAAPADGASSRVAPSRSFPPERAVTPSRTPHAGSRSAPLSAPPSLPPTVPQYFLPAGVSLNRALAADGGAHAGPLEPQGLVYKPAMLAQAEVRYLLRKYNLDGSRQLTCLVPTGDPADNARPDWGAFTRPPLDPSLLGETPSPEARFCPLPGEWSTARNFSALQRDFAEWVYRTSAISLRANEELKVYASPEMPEIEFRRMIDNAVQAGMQPELLKVAAGFDKRLEDLGRKIERQQLRVGRHEEEVDQRQAEQHSADFDFLTGLFSKRKKSITRNISKRRMTAQARGELEEAEKVLKQLNAEYQALQREREDALRRVHYEWQQRAARIQPLTVTPLKKDIYVAQFGIAWLPYHQVKSPVRMIELAAF